MTRTRSICSSLAASALLAATAAAQAPAVNLAKHQSASGTATGDFRAEFATDGKLGPENRWVGPNRTPRLSINFDQPVTVGAMRVFTGGYGGPVLANAELYYYNGSTFVAVPGSSITGNTGREMEISFTPVQATQFQLRSTTNSASVLEVVLLPPGGPYPITAGVEPNAARQHRVALTTASSTAAGTSRRSVVDGFVSDQAYWQGSGNGTPGQPHWIALDMRDPPETNPARVRTVTSPLEIGSVHIYSGTDAGDPAVSRGRVQMWDENLSQWTTIAGAEFSNNTDKQLDVVFDAPVTTAFLRLYIDDTVSPKIREIVPLPPRDNNAGWPIGAGVRFGVRPSFTGFDDAFYALGPTGSGLAISAGGVLAPDSGDRAEHYQVILKVSTDEYWIRNRETGLALAPAGMSTADGAPVVEEPYSGLPHQNWRLEDNGGSVRLVNAFSGLALAPTSLADGATLVQQTPGGADELWTIDFRDTNDKKGHGGYASLAPDTQPAWAYSWGMDDSYPAEVDFWPMQWGTFNWMGHYRVPAWQRADEAIVHMGFNEPDGADQSDIPVDVALNMWPRLEARDMPLLSPAPVNPTNTWITDFEAGAQDMELRIEYQAVHRYSSPNADGFMSALQTVHSTYGRKVVVSEFSCVDWNNTNNWNKDQVYNFFAEIFWRMENTDWLRQFAVFMFKTDPNNNISDNRGETVDELGALTPLGEMLAAWDGDTTIRTDTPYYIHSRGVFERFGVAPGQNGSASIVVGDRFDRGSDFQWMLIPSGQPGLYLLRASDGRIARFDALAETAELVDASAAGDPGTLLAISEVSNGWFRIVDPAADAVIRINDQSVVDVKSPVSGYTGDWTQFRFVPVFLGAPGAPNNVASASVGGADVLVGWTEHGFRDLLGFDVYRSGPGGGPLALIAQGVRGSSYLDQVPEVGSYSYGVVAVGDTGESPMATAPVLAVSTCEADFNADFTADNNDVLDLIGQVESGLDYNGDSADDFFDVIDYLRVYDAGCQ